MTETDLQEFIDEYIMPLIPGTFLEGPLQAKNLPQAGKQIVEDWYNLKVYPFPDQKTHFLIRKRNPYSVEELRFLNSLVQEFFHHDPAQGPFKAEISQRLVEQAIARFMHVKYDVIQSVMALYGEWSSQTYEGSRIAHTIGIDFSLVPSTTGTMLETIRDKEFLKVIGSGFNTILVLDEQGAVATLSTLDHSSENNAHLFAPLSMLHIARWAEGENKVAISVTRNGEVLLFKNNMLLFAKRRGTWRYFPHKLLIDKIFRFSEKDGLAHGLRKALYLTALDVAFTRSGACLGLAGPTFPLDKSSCISAECLLRSPKSDCAEFINRLVGTAKFEKLPRAVRAELSAIDGATVVNTDGNILTSGAILKTDGNAGGGGGRTTAARTIANNGGLGIKISNDGMVVLFTKDEAGVLKEFSFA